MKYDLETAIDYVSNPEKTICSSSERERLEAKQREFVKKNQEVLQAVIDYAMNEKKTKNEEVKFVSGINCNSETCCYEMAELKKRYKKEDKIQAYHSYQSFPEGEVTAELCHQIGVETAKRMWGETAQVAVATHLNTEHLHNHFVVNSVSLDGHKLVDNEKNYYRLRAISDEVCKEYGLSIVDIKQTKTSEFSEDSPSGNITKKRKELAGERNSENGKTANKQQNKKNYTDWKKLKETTPTVRSEVKADVDRLIEQSNSFADFINQMRKEGYFVKTKVKHIAVRPKGKDRFVRLRSLGEDYTAEKIAERIYLRKHPNEKLKAQSPIDIEVPKRTAHYKPQGKYYKVYGFSASIYIKKVRLYYDWLPREWQGKTLEEIKKQEQKQLIALSEQSFYLVDNKIKTMTELLEKRRADKEKMSELFEELGKLREELKTAEDDDRIQEIVQRTSAVKLEIGNLKRELKTNDDIENRFYELQKLDKKRSKESARLRELVERKELAKKSGTTSYFRNGRNDRKEK